MHRHVEVEAGRLDVADAPLRRVEGLGHRREEADEAVAQADTGDDGAAVADDGAGDRPLDQPGPGAVGAGTELLGEPGGIDHVGEQDDGAGVGRDRPDRLQLGRGAAQLLRAGHVVLEAEAAEGGDRLVEQREPVAALAPPEVDGGEVGLRARQLGDRAQLVGEGDGALQGGDGVGLVAEEVLRHAEVARHQRRGAADEHPAAPFDLGQEVARLVQVAGGAFPLRELDRQHRPRVPAHERFAGQSGEGRTEHGQTALARGDPAGEEVDAGLLERVGGLRPRGQRLARLLELAARRVRARDDGQEEPGGPVVPGQALQQERPVRVLLGLVEVAAGDRDLRERGERQSQLQRVLRALGDVAALERACLGLVEPAEPGEHERHPEHRPTREQRLVGRGARVGHAVLQRRQRTVQVVARPLRHAERGGGARVGGVVVVLFGDRHGPARALRRLLHAPLDPVRLRQLHQCLGRQLGVVGLELVDQLLERLAVGHHRQHLAGADAAADAPEVELGAGGGVGVGPEQVRARPRSG